MPPVAEKLPLNKVFSNIVFLKTTMLQILLDTPVITIENPKEAAAIELLNRCYKSPIAVIRGLTAALKIDLSLFSTKTLIQTAPDHEV